MATPVVQYGCRDDDDDSDGGSRRGKLFHTPRQLKKLGNPKKKLGSLINETRTLLAGASGQSNLSHLYGLKDDYDEEDSSSSYESESDSDDDASVCSKASVASKASQTLKKFGSSFSNSFRGLSHSNHNKSSKHEHDVLVLETDHHEEAGSVHSKNSRASAVKRVKGTLSKALKVSRRRGSGKKDEEAYESDDDSLSSEEDLFLDTTAKPRRGLKMHMPALTRSKSGDVGTRKTNRKPIRRTLSSDGMPGTIRKPRRHTTMERPHHLDDHHDDGHVSDLSDDDSDHHRDDGPAIPTTRYSNNWSMNVTPEILEQVTAVSEGSNRGKGWDMNVPKNLLVVGMDHHSSNRAA